MAQNMKPIWDEIIEIYKAFSAVCDRNGLKYWAAYGTLLGAIRHKGFIPWDDDMDIHMMREDYEKFLAIADKELPPYFRVVNHRNTKEYNMPFAKVQETRKEVYDKIQGLVGNINPHGFYIDIFPVDGIPDGAFQRFKLFLECYLLACRESYLFRKGKHSGLRGWISEFIGSMLGPVFPKIKTRHDLTYRQDEIARRFRAQDCVECARYFTMSNLLNFWHGKKTPWTWHVPSRIFCETTTLPMYGILIPATKDWNLNLTANFGPDYMTPPCKDQQHSCHNVCELAPWIYGPTGND